MLNAYIVPPSKLVVRTDNTPTLNPLAFSAAQLNSRTKNPIGLISVEGNAYIGSADELPVFVRYKDGRADILERPDTEAVTYSSFMVSGTTLLILEHQSLEIKSTLMRIRSSESINRVAIGLLDDGNVFVVYCTATVEQLQTILIAHGVTTALLLASDDVYFSNPRRGIAYGEQPIISLQATYYEELENPIILIDPAHGGAESGSYAHGVVEKNLTLAIAKAMQAHLKEHYCGVFALTRDCDKYLPLSTRKAIADTLQPDFVYACHVDALDDAVRGCSCRGCSDTSDTTRALTERVYDSLIRLVAPRGIADGGIRYVSYPTGYKVACPSIAVNSLCLNDDNDIKLLMNPEILRLLGAAQGEALAQSLEIPKRIGTSKLKAATDDKQFYVRVGKGYRFKLGALELCEKLRQSGFDAYVTRE